jgi:putative tryptophan/tyrosine transport system substrate-binding protein
MPQKPAAGASVATWTYCKLAQRVPGRSPCCFLGAGSPTTADVWVSAFMSRLRELGWIEGRNIKIDVRWAEGRNDRSAEIAAELEL